MFHLLIPAAVGIASAIRTSKEKARASEGLGNHLAKQTDGENSICDTISETDIQRYHRQPSDVEQGIIAEFARMFHKKEAFYIWSDIPNDKLLGAASTYLHLLDDELLLAVHDNTAFAKNAKDGFTLTTKRIYWRDSSFTKPKKLEYTKIIGPVKLTDKLVLGITTYQLSLGDDDSCLVSTELIQTFAKLPEFLATAARMLGNPAKTASDNEAASNNTDRSEEITHARVLGLRGKVTFSDIKNHYRERMMEYHPDKVAALGPKLRALAEEETKQINLAYEFFTDKYASPRNTQTASSAQDQEITPFRLELLKLMQAAEKGDARSQGILGYLYRGELSGAFNIQEAAKFAQRSASQNNPFGFYSLSRIYVTGEGFVKEESQAADLGNKALSGLRPLAEGGDAWAQAILGLCYSVIQPDASESVKWFLRAAEQGNATAQRNMGSSYLHGNGISKDESKAIEWFQKSAEQGYADAQYCLGLFYREGYPLPKDNTKAVVWLHKAANQGHPLAQQLL